MKDKCNKYIIFMQLDLFAFQRKISGAFPVENLLYVRLCVVALPLLRCSGYL